MADEIEIRPYQDSDLEAVLDTMRAALGEPPGLGRTPHLFAWKHLDNPFGKSLMLVADAAGEIAGFRAFMRWEMLTPAGETLRCVRAVDTAAHPDFQRRGIFKNLTLAGIEAATEDGVDMIFNTPNEKSGAGYLKMGWLSVGPIGIMARPGLGLASPKSDWKTVPALDAPSAIDSELADLFSKGTRHGLRTPRHLDYLRWRFGAHPTGQYAVATAEDGAAIARLNRRSDRRELVLSELVGIGAPRAARALIKQLRPAYAAGWFSEGTDERALAMKAGLVPVPKVSALTLVARPLRDLPLDVSDPSNWHIGLGDLELL